jgi:predicted ArsR family transcriptional regulator
MASEVAEGLGVHTSTASKHLAAFYEAGFLDREAHAAKRPTHAYRLRSPIIRLEVDLEERNAPAEAREFAFAFAEALLAASHRVGGDRLMNSLARAIWREEDWRPCLEEQFATEPHPRAVVDALLQGARRASTELLGATTGGRIFRMAWDATLEGRPGLVALLGLVEVTA